MIGNQRIMFVKLRKTSIPVMKMNIWKRKIFWILPSMMEKTMGCHCMKYELIDSLKNLRPTMILRTKELSLVISEITKLCMLYLFECIEVLLLVCLVYVVWLSVMCLLGWLVRWFLIL